MAIDNLNYYSAGLPAGQQTDRYSSQPGCLRSKNLDIFSSSKSVKATARSEPVNADENGVVLVDQTGKLVLKSDGNVYDKSSGNDTLVYSGVATKFPSYKVSYNGKTGTYNDAQWGTPLELISKYENGVLKYFTIFTDKSRLGYTTVPYSVTDDNETYTSSGWTETDHGTFHKSSSSKNTTINIAVSGGQGLTNVNLYLKANNPSSDTEGHLTITGISFRKPKYWYNAETEEMEFRTYDESVSVEVTDQLDDSTDKYIRIPIPLVPDTGGYTITVSFTVTPPEGSTTYTWSSGELFLDVEGYNYYYNYLSDNSQRDLVSVGEYYWEKGTSFQTFYSWGQEWTNDSNGARVVRYSLVKYMGWDNDSNMDVIGMTVWNEQVYMIGNMYGNGYIIPCDLTGGKGTPYIAYGCEFKGVTNIDYLLYLVGEDRGISTLWVFNNQELVPVIGGREEKDSINLIENEELYKFDGKIVNWRKNLILTTEDNRIFQYGQTYGGKGGAFINELQWNITDIKTVGNELVADFWLSTERPIDTYSGEPPYGDASFQVKVYVTPTTPYTYSHIGHSTTAGAILDRLNSYTGGHYTGLSLYMNGYKLASDYPLAGTSDDPVVVYVVPDTIDIKKSISYQDDTPIKNYNLEWMAEYPIVIGNHLLEKEESDLFVSYILPSSDCSLEFWGMANHYHFRTFTSEDDYTFNSELAYRLKGATGDYELKFIERNGNQYTFRLVGDLPIQTTNDMKITDTGGVELINYSEYNHFRKIGEITTTEYQEGEFRFHNLNNKLELPKSHSLQVMVKGKGNQNYTPELFALDLVANQRERG